MQLLKIRGFNEFFQDTFTFIKENGKHFFKHFFIVNGFFLVLLIGMFYVFMSSFLSKSFIGFGENLNINTIDNFMNENFGWFVIFIAVFIIIALFAGIMSYAYTPIYLKLYNENNGSHFSTRKIINSYKFNTNKLIIFLFLGFLVAVPLSMITVIAMVILIFTIVGLLIMPFILGLFTLLFNNTLLEYLHEKNNFWNSMQYVWTLMTTKFWASAGSVGLFILMSYIIQFVLQIIYYLFTSIRSLTVLETANNNSFDLPPSIIIFMIILFILQFITSILMSSVIQINQGIIYFSLKEEKENINTKSVIDQIGSNEN